MLDAGGGGGYGGTNWSAASVIDMWLAVGNQETTPHWELLAGWRKSYELTQQHMAAVKNYRENLAAAWPPEKSAASAAYIERLDNLIEHLQHTYDAAVANYGAFSSATSALSSARGDLKKVVDEYLANQTELAAFEKEQADKPTSGGLMRRPAVKPPVADGRQAQLEAQARTIMFGLSAEVIQARALITKPKLYDQRLNVDNQSTDRSSPEAAPPPIPPVLAFDPGSGGTSSPHQPGPASAHGPTQPSGTAPTGARHPGLVLGGIDPPTATPPSVNAPSVIGSGSPQSLNPGPFQPTPPTRLDRLAPARGAGRGIVGVPTQPTAGAMRVMPPGGVIGGPPGSALGVPAAGRPMPAVNPVGGVLNPGPPSGQRAPTGRVASPPVQPVGSLAPRSNSVEGEAVNKKWDPDNPWATAEGTPPVVLPQVEQRVDPGPAIGLH